MDTVRTANGMQITTWPTKQRGEAHVLAPAEILEELQQPDAGDQRRKHQRPERKRDERLAAAEPIPVKRKGQRQREDRR